MGYKDVVVASGEVAHIDPPVSIPTSEDSRDQVFRFFVLCIYLTHLLLPQVLNNAFCLTWLLDQFPKDHLSLPPPLVLGAPVYYPATGILHTSACAECYLRLWVLEHPNNPLTDAFSSFLAGGFSIRILTATSPSSVPLPPFPGFLRLNRRGSDIASVYRSNLANVLSRPNARRFLTYGGLLWRLALHYSEAQTSQDLLVAALSGPSALASLVEVGLYDDEVCEEEIAALVGTAADGFTLWPPEAVFYRSDRWTGRWTPDNESWFQKHLLKMSMDFTSCFRTRREWLRNGFQTRRKAAQNTIGSEEYARRVCAQHDAEFSPFPVGRLTNF